MSREQEAWDHTYRRMSAQGVIEHGNDQSWLSAFVPRLRQDGIQSILELGCGSGVDTHVLVSNGFHVTATDFSAEALRLARTAVPQALFRRHDLREPFPFNDHAFEGVIASLCLHYFDPLTTRTIIREVERVMRPGGLLLVRLNSTADAGARRPQHPDVQRFFYTAELCRDLFAGWTELQLQELTVEYFGSPKVLWQGLFRRPDR